jgi:hypothetical protein
MRYFGWHYEILPDFSTCVESDIGSHQRQVHDRYTIVFVSELELACFPLHLRQCLRDSVDSLEQF